MPSLSEGLGYWRGSGVISNPHFQISELGLEMVFEQAEETQISELGLEIVFEEV